MRRFASTFQNLDEEHKWMSRECRKKTTPASPAYCHEARVAAFNIGASFICTSRFTQPFHYAAAGGSETQIFCIRLARVVP